MDGSSQHTAHWVGFAGFMILIAGTLECVWVAIGWLVLTAGVVQLSAALMIWSSGVAAARRRRCGVWRDPRARLRSCDRAVVACVLGLDVLVASALADSHLATK